LLAQIDLDRCEIGILGQQLHQVALALEALDRDIVAEPRDHDLARARLGRPLPNTTLLGALAGLTGIVTLDALQQAIRRLFAGSAGDLNAELAADGYKAGAVSRVSGGHRAPTG